MSREEICRELVQVYGWSEKELLNYNDNQLRVLYSACKDENGNLRKPEK